ncbi:SUF system Fe-S cluster assembly protein [Rhizosaccharibacter radicis]|uniref:SUF system Fe-S cluster assembly protein n=1 Tax=Rhizosaccharibacter radicis TaxID=2782605 RepID=A0ABT1W087_9PROT|nr:SUF system Fe-S cluster assembly protein [Acetobacteraceae bacterium KSS12]
MSSSPDPAAPEALPEDGLPRRRPNFGGEPPASSSPSHVSAWTPDGEQPGKVGETAVLDAIATIYDPEIPVNIYELGLIYAVDLHDDGRVKVEMTLTAPNCPSAQDLPVQVRDAVQMIPGVAECEVEIVWDPPWDPTRMSDEARLALNMY